MDEIDLAEIRNRRIGFVFQQFNLLPSLTALRNVELPLSYAGVAREQRRQRARGRWIGSAWPTASTTGRASCRAGSSSGSRWPGRWSRDPALLLADEPTGQPRLKRQAEEVLRLFDELHGQGRTVVLITHEAEVAERAAGSIRIRDGAIASDDRRGGGHR